MKSRMIPLFALAGLSACAGGQAANPAQDCEAAKPAPDAPSKKIVARAEGMGFGPCPPGVRFACEMAVLEGSPKSSGLFTIRLRTTEAWVMPPHTHPRDERVTVMSGRINVGFGPTVDKSGSESFTAGDYYVNPPSSLHYVWTDEPVEIQITGMGPWEVHPHQE